MMAVLTIGNVSIYIDDPDVKSINFFLILFDSNTFDFNNLVCLRGWYCKCVIDYRIISRPQIRESANPNNASVSYCYI